MKTVEQTRRELFELRFGWPAMKYLYTEDERDALWAGFNAALDAVEIELPEDTWSGDIGDQVMIADDVRAAIESTNLGLKIR